MKQRLSFLVALALVGCGNGEPNINRFDGGNNQNNINNQNNQNNADDMGSADLTDDTSSDMSADTTTDTGSDMVVENCGPTVASPYGGERRQEYDIWFDVDGTDVGARSIRVWPPAIDLDGARDYKVLYMHDGQNLFRDVDAPFGVSWRVQEALAQTDEEWIVVGIDNTGARIDDYTPTADQAFGGGGNGDAYSDYLIDVVVPFIEATYPVACGPQNRAMGGSSLGGLITLHTIMRHPDQFAAAIVMSPSLWWDNENLLLEFENNFNGPLPRIWIDGGTEESARTPEGTTNLIEQIRRFGARAEALGSVRGQDIVWMEDVHAPHTEAAWARRMHFAVPFALDGADLSTCATTALVPHRVGFYSFFTSGQPQATIFTDDCGLPNQVADADVVANNGATFAGGVLDAPTAGTVDLSVTIGGQTLDTTIEVIDAPTAEITFRVFVPQGLWYPETVYVSGNNFALGNFDGAGLELRPSSPTEWIGTIRVPDQQSIEFKATRGTFNEVEKDANGGEIANRQFFVNGDTEIPFFVERWADQ